MPADKALTFQNPLRDPGADPWLQYHNGQYYLVATNHAAIKMRHASSLRELRDAEDVVVWQDNTPSRSEQMWAPEFFLLDGPNGRRWYLYYTACDGPDLNHRMFVCEAGGDDPLGPYAFKAQLATDPVNALYAIDGTVIAHPDGSLYFVWAGHPGHRLYISKMDNPWTLTGERALIEASGFGCDEVREGPVALQRDGHIFLVYSACDTGKPDYKLGMLVADALADPIDPASWRQHPDPVFTRCDDNGVYGPGHNHFFKSPDGTEDWIVYHAKTSSEYTYEGRSTRAQRFSWNDEGLPAFGEPVSLDTQITEPSGTG